MKRKENLTLRKVRALETKKLIFDSAIKLINEKGYDGVSIDDITTQAGTAKGTFYIYFKNKEHIILERFKKIDNAYLRFFKKLNKNQPASQNLLSFVKDQQKFALSNFGLELLKVVYISQLTPNKEKIFLADENRVLYKIVDEIINRGQQEGEFRKDISAKELTSLVTFMMRSFLYEWCINDGKFDLIETGQRFFSMFINDMLKSRPT
ncbi:MAG: TetR/AcrR family transcriptional regulator [Dethiobacter sp.]|jgi:AcrR family transcriptional regulator|nr:TetR/AcrR family transcriptional regulator [Dethiobacter sp.]